MTTGRMSRRECLSAAVVVPIAAMTVTASITGAAQAAKNVMNGSIIGKITKFSPRLDSILDVSTPIEVISSNIQWSEGPVWIKNGSYLLFSDPPANIMRKWTADGGTSIFLKPSGHVEPVPAGQFREPGSNGMKVGPDGKVWIADSGSRAIMKLDPVTRQRTVVVDNYKGKRFNSPNDLIISKSGAVYFTDPPYGLTNLDESDIKEMNYNGVFRLSPDGKLDLIEAGLSRPNGLALSPDETKLYVSNSDRASPNIWVYSMGTDGLPTGRTLLRNFRKEYFDQGLPGLPDGMNIDKQGNLFASASGGLYIFAPDGECLGLIAGEPGQALSNCCFGEQGQTLFISACHNILRVRTKTFG
ncbi:MAG: gluconolactonase [Zymomonas mobilis subsp. pomaceae]|uniref:Gluconolactonase n=1 Tax=Zymomonas mobilis subsp. pomaceae (strain ATCC 29192 / DSM 22645 / JCM 10191 / CCUG 17912 / NBRC 13757 / NCIMB 11200 / NRRL B-4491 / Barker I) TaxID=579138 RepID=F8EVL9_ZYMMT|nr:gluconolactonase [Zymomonas mobilis]AEI38356.1 Gluconolactonase [Zymomonas mobilis subsp. pomaceae ATCC 29192]MDX5948045.1 SMP-30/gluconolactonase/LRE family protein [Zymomonas mobilis subsp. pomaceae]GEB89375.1 gluconolactonase [Zymomonas mobilis subsp. pomaceae]